MVELHDIYREHYEFVWRVVRRFGVPAEAIDDAVQEVFMVVHRRRATLDFSGSIRGLLYGIARRVAARARPSSTAFATDHEPPGRGTSPDVHVELREKAEVIRTALAGLDADRRTTFMLVDIEGMTAPEVARCLNVNLNTVYGRLRVARQHVHEAVRRHLLAQDRRPHVATR